MHARHLAVLLAFATALSAAPPLVRNPRPLPVAGTGGVFAIHGGNFGGDPAKDVLTIVQGHSIQVLINEAGGLTGAPVISALTETGISGNTTGDLDGDGDLDVALTLWDTQRIVTYLNGGNGTFTRGTVILGQRPGPLAIADFTRDGHADLALARNDPATSGGEIMVFAGNGAGAFAAPIRTALPFVPSVARLTDANGDGKFDLLMSTSYSVGVALGHGDGTFVVSRVDNDVTPRDLAVGDFNGDGAVDFAVTGYAYLKSGFLRVFRGSGTGSFTAAGDYFGMEYYDVLAADVDADGHLDLVGSGNANFAVLRGNGDTTFDAPELWHTGPAGMLVAGDFSRDGIADLVMGGGGGSTGMQLVPGTGGGAFDTYRGFLPNGAMPHSSWHDRFVSQLTAADMNGDGAPDVVTVAVKETFGDIDLVVMLNANDGTAKLSAPMVTHTDIGDGASIGVGDVNGDGKQDIVVVRYASWSPGSSRTYLGRGDGTFDAPVEFMLSAGGSPMLADVTGDGVPDLIVTRYSDATLFRGRNDGRFDTPLALYFPVHRIGDVNGDGRADLVGHGSRDTVIAINNGDGTAFTQTILGDGDYPGIAALADLNGDGKLDLLSLFYGYGTFTRLGNGDGTFGEPQSFALLPSPYESGSLGPGLGVGDFDADGKLDLARGARFYLGAGSGRFDGYASLFEHHASAMDVADFDGNGTDDVAMLTGSDVLTIVPTALGPDPALTPALGLDLTPDPPRYATPTRLIATVTGGAIPPTGAVVHSVDGVPFAMHAADRLGQGAYSPGLPIGAHAFTATYTGDDEYVGATATLQRTVGRAVTTIFTDIDGSPAPCGNKVYLYAQLSAPTATGLPGPSSGLVFREGNTPLQVEQGPQGAQWYMISGLGTGTHTITIEFAGDANYEPYTANVVKQITPSINATFTAGSAVYAGGTGYANVNTVSPGTYAWTVTNGTIDSGQGTPGIRYTAGPTGEVTIGLTITRTWCSDTKSVTIPIVQPAPGASMFHLLRACRVVDTRGGEPLANGATREIALAGVCGIPSDAKSLVVNVTVVSPAGTGWLSLYAADAIWTGTSTVNYRPGRTRANGAVVAVSPGARLNVRHSGPAAHFLIDVLGFFR